MGAVFIEFALVKFLPLLYFRENKMEKAITFSKGKLEDLELPDKYDYIVSEWMGYFLLFEGMLDSVLYARDHHLAPGGLLMPNRCSLHLLGIEDLGIFLLLLFIMFVRFYLYLLVY